MLNAYKLRNMNPTNFVRNTQNCTFVATKALNETKQTVCSKTYKKLNPQNKALACGVFFQNLFTNYLKYLNINLQEPVLKAQKEYISNFTKISDIEYNLMPKRYRELFIKQNKSNYILREHDEPLEITNVFTAKKSDIKELEQLLLNAKILIPLVYKTRWVDVPAKNGSPKTTVSELDFAPKYSLSAQFVKSQKLETIQKLYTIFQRIDDLTLAYQRPEYRLEYRHKKLCQRYGARDLFAEYQKEQEQKNKFIRMQMFPDCRTK